MQMLDRLRTHADAVTDEASFIEFISALASDRADECAKEKASPSSPYGPGANGWENGTIEAFLDAASEWASASCGGLANYNPSANPWTRCAHILLIGKHSD
jgi:hypothetical protein